MSRMRSPVVDTRTSSSARSVTGTKVAEPYCASTSGARKAWRWRRLKRSRGRSVPSEYTVRGAVALRADGDGAEERPQREQRRGGEEAHGEAERSRAKERDDRAKEEERTERPYNERGDGKRRDRDAGRHPASLVGDAEIRED